MSLLMNAQHGWVLWPALVVAVAAAVWSYRRVPPTVGPRLRAALAALRAVALGLLVLALSEPVLSLVRSEDEPPVVAVLLDASRSMAIADGDGGVSRAEEALAAVNGTVLPRLARGAVVRAYAFSSGVEEAGVSGGLVASAPAAVGGVTDIGTALSALRDELTGANLAAVIVASDGANNRGPAPVDAAAALGVPVFTVGVGSPEPRADVAITEAVTNRVSYVGEGLPVEARLTAHGFGDARTVATLSEDGRTLDSRPVTLSGGEETVVAFRVVPDAPGAHRYTVSVPTAPGELTDANNSRIVVTNTLRAKIRVLIAGARPSSDYAFLRRELSRDRNAEVTAAAPAGPAGTAAGGAQGAQGAAGGAPTAGRDADALPRSRDELLAYDLVVLVEPDWARPVVRADWLASFVRERGGGLLALGLPESSGTPSAEFLSVLPLAGRPRESEPVELRVALTEAGEAAPTMRVVSDRHANAALWQALPPVWAVPSAPWTVRPDATVLAETLTPDGSHAPLVAAARDGAGRSMAVAADGVWRWKMAGPDDADAYGRFVASAVRLLTARGDVAPLSVSTERDVVAAGEPVQFTAQVMTDELRPATDATVTVSVATGPGAAPLASFQLDPSGDSYRGESQALPPGAYQYEAEAVRGGETVGRASGQFVVEPFSLEDSETRRRPSLLMEIAEATGGAYHSQETLDAFPEGARLEAVRTERVREFEVWNSPWLLVGFLGCLSAEWTVRRMKGLA